MKILTNFFSSAATKRPVITILVVETPDPRTILVVQLKL